MVYDRAIKNGLRGQSQKALLRSVMSIPGMIVALGVGVWGVGGCVSAQPAHPLAKGATNDPPGPVVASSTADEPDRCEGLPRIMVEDSYADGTVSIRSEAVEAEDGEQINDGLTTHFWPNGQEKLVLRYDCGVRNGLRVAWYQNGQKWSQGEFRHGHDHGTWTIWYPDGSKQKQFTLVDGSFEDSYTVWHPNGKVKLKTEYRNGLRQGPIKLWDDAGVLVKHVDFVDGIPQPTP